MSRRILAPSLLVLATLLGLPGCGGSTDPENSARAIRFKPEIGLPVDVDPTLQKQEYLARANRICRQSWESMRKDSAYDRSHELPGTPRRSQVFAHLSRSSFLPHIQFWFDDISYLGAPKGDRALVEDMLKVLQLSVYSGEERRITSPAMISAVFGGFNRLARAYGLKSCIADANAFEELPAV